jgi:hypothetical protein
MFDGPELEYPGKLYEVDPALLWLLPRLLYFRKKVEFDEFVSFSDGLFGTDVVFEVAFS